MVFDDEMEEIKDQQPSSNVKNKIVVHPDDLPVAPGIPYSIRELEANYIMPCLLSLITKVTPPPGRK